MSTAAHMARELARALLAGQTDKAGRPAFDHAARVAGRVGSAAAPLAWLHDLVEDTDLTLRAVEAIFGSDMATDLCALTRREDESYAEYISRVCVASPTAQKVKLADLEDHLDLAADIPASLVDRYTKAHERLEEALGIERGSSTAAAMCGPA